MALVAAVCPVLTLLNPAAAFAQPFQVETIAPNVRAAIMVDPLGLANHANADFFVGE